MLNPHQFHPGCSVFAATRAPRPGAWSHRVHHRAANYINTEAVPSRPKLVYTT